jgi:ribonucleoside-diphosphate reductase alpha chain
MYEDGKPGEIFLVMAKEGSTISGLMDAFATSISMALQYGVPLETLVDKFAHVRFEPSGFTKNPQIPMAKSITDYIFRWMASKFLGAEYQERIGNQVDAPGPEGSETAVKAVVKAAAAVDAEVEAPKATYKVQSDAPTCHFCGSIMVRNAACYKCTNCGSTSGCS